MSASQRVALPLGAHEALHDGRPPGAPAAKVATCSDSCVDVSARTCDFDSIEDGRILGIVGARRLVDRYRQHAQSSMRETKELLRERRMDAAASSVLLDSPHAELWNLVAASACRNDRSAFHRLTRLADGRIDLTLAIMRAEDLSGVQATALALRIANRLEAARATTDVGFDDPVERRRRRVVRGQIDILRLAGHSLLVSAPHLGEAAVPLLRAGLRPDSILIWAAGDCPTPMTASTLQELLDDPGMAFGSQVRDLYDTHDSALRRYLLGPALISYHADLVSCVLASPDDRARHILATALGGSLFDEATRNELFAAYIDDRIADIAGDDESAGLIGRQLAEGWPHDIDELLRIVTTVRTTNAGVQLGFRHAG